MVVACPDSGNRAGKSWIVLAYTVTADQLINFSCRNVTSCVNFGFPNTYIHVPFSFLWAVVEPNALYVNCSFALPLEMQAPLSSASAVETGISNISNVKILFSRISEGFC